MQKKRHPTCASFPVSFKLSKTATQIRTFSVGAQGVSITIICFGARTFIDIYEIKVIQNLIFFL